MEGGRGGEKKKLLSPPPPPSFLFLLSSQLSRRSHAETLVMQASSLLVSKVANNCLVSQCLITDCYCSPVVLLFFLVSKF